MIDWRRKGEWLELTAAREPSDMKDAEALLPECFKGKWFAKWHRSGGIEWKGTRIRLRLFPEEPLHYMSDWAEVEVLFEDDFCLVANKPSGMKVHPTQEGERGTLQQAVQWHLEGSGQTCRARHIHRLDEDTTGPVLFAKNEWSQTRLDAFMRDKRIGRHYVALVQGRPANAEGIVDAPIGRDRHHATRRRVSRTGEPAVTRYQVIERYRSAALLRLMLETGRTHQIRVHMSYLGHPLIGDTLYGGEARGVERQALHGEKLLFPHPLTEESIEVGAPWPSDFAGLSERLKK
ncbi:RluA family pseudouridine synthase [Paenibacillus allorhizosphaerae]|uniref:Pseudouridine synthase n=1 Tax=Paenibacillus allorhizosphaerae TaxID=2849866 RepID=A0ABN7TTP1_9BACL|nr:RluA family pseudouridine synthase [Paenibacillus allorhizosphaerae]CAG7655372.1 Ribosomal large subunit pseudouridine synthase D [Paenibacillus allorhizosphaerae]